MLEKFSTEKYKLSSVNFLKVFTCAPQDEESPKKNRTIMDTSVRKKIILVKMVSFKKRYPIALQTLKLAFQFQFDYFNIYFLFLPIKGSSTNGFFCQLLMMRIFERKM